MNKKIVPTLLFIAFYLSQHAFAEIYRYQDENGKWHYTDSPPEDKKDSETLNFKGQKMDGHTNEIDQDLAAYLNEKIQPGNDIETISMSVVKVKIPGVNGNGSGFFVSNDGYIISNKHVVKPMSIEQFQQLDERVKQSEQQVKAYKKQLAQEKKNLREIKNWLAEEKKAIGSSRIRQLEYEKNLANYNSRKADYEKYKEEFDEFYTQYKEDLRDWKAGKSKSRAASTYTIILKDETELDARLIKVSKEHDLALLKLKGNYSTPYLHSAHKSDVTQGMEVFAMGNPLGFSDFVTQGIIVGFEKQYIMTDANIQPGNSGGPLVTPKGKVIGINTLKHIAGGYGYAIPITTAHSEFASFLNMSPPE